MTFDPNHHMIWTANLKLGHYLINQDIQDWACNFIRKWKCVVMVASRISRGTGELSMVYSYIPCLYYTSLILTWSLHPWHEWTLWLNLKAHLVHWWIVLRGIQKFLKEDFHSPMASFWISSLGTEVKVKPLCRQNSEQWAWSFSMETGNHGLFD